MAGLLHYDKRRKYGVRSHKGIPHEQGVPGYVGYNSDSEVFTHILHYLVRQLHYSLTYYKDIVTPLKAAEIEKRRDREVLNLLKKSFRMLCIDGPNCVYRFYARGHLLYAAGLQETQAWCCRRE